MASRTIHLAITKMLEKQYAFHDIDRLRFGTIVPDAAINRQEYARSHFKIKISNHKGYPGDFTDFRGERSYDLTGFRKQFGDLMKTDDLYLGYYLHLIQDLLYRHFIYDRYHWNPALDGSLERLYDDYRQINAYVTKKYRLTKEIPLPVSFENEQINKIAVLDPSSLLEEYKKDFVYSDYNERFFFTNSMADEYIQWAAEYCTKELNALANETCYFDEYKWSWGKK